MRKSEKKALIKGVRSAFHLSGRRVTRRHSAEDNLHASWYNVGVFLTRGMEKVNDNEKIDPEKKFRRLSTF